MKILLTEAHAGDAQMVGGLLAVEGHHIAFCHADRHHVRCGGLTGAGCPLLAGDIDVVVDVRLQPGQVTQREFGALCAIQRGTPLVVAGSMPAESMIAEFAVMACPPDSAGAACAGIQDAARV
jgi:hypothetical protein